MLVICGVYKGAVEEWCVKRVAMKPQTNVTSDYEIDAHQKLLENASELELKYEYCSYNSKGIYYKSLDVMVALCQKNGLKSEKGASSLRSTSATLLLVLISTMSDVCLHARV